MEISLTENQQQAYSSLESVCDFSLRRGTICLIGDFEQTRPSERQWSSLVKLVKFLQARYRIPSSKIKGHSDIKATKCPGNYFPLSELRSRIAR